jgi:formylglycine-generating enzyme required for sulfatase activity
MTEEKLTRLFSNRTAIMALFLLLLSLPTYSQTKPKFSLVSFREDPRATAASQPPYRQTDDDGNLFAIVKVRSTNPDDDLRQFTFDFGMLYHRVVEGVDDELWLYVQQNAKTVTIGRPGYQQLTNYDLRTTIRGGHTYELMLQLQAAPVYRQFLQFDIRPADAHAIVVLSQQGAQQEMLNDNDGDGQIVKSMPLGSYSYQVMAENYYPSEGVVTLKEANGTHKEQVTLKPNFAVITLNVNADADILVNGELKGRRQWSGKLRPGQYAIECRQDRHQTTTQTITVEENQPRTYTLIPPVPIVGTLQVVTEPLGASVTIDGQERGVTPLAVSDLLIGQHSLSLNLANHKSETRSFEIKEKDVTSLEVALSKAVATPVKENVVADQGNSRTFTITGHGKTVTFTMKHVAAGTFQMGGSDSYAGSDEKPVHSVTLTKDYYMGETEVTQALWYAVMGQKPTNVGSAWSSNRGLGDSYPAYNISYEDCQTFIASLNSKLSSQLNNGEKFRFPTEAQWEYAARGGNRSQGYIYAGSNTIEDVAWYTDNSGSKTHKVKGKQANELGLYDMSGNVWEWCLDWYNSRYYSSSPATDPVNTTKASGRVNRGGGWNNLADYCRVALRNFITPAFRNGTLGLRLALQ